MFPMAERSDRVDGKTVATWVFVAFTSLCFLLAAVANPSYSEGSEVARQFGLVPRTFWQGAVHRLMTHAFVHGSAIHLVVNMWALLALGRAVERRLGTGRFVALYLGSALAGGLIYAVVFPADAIPAIGASGAVAGVMAAYVFVVPNGRIWTMLACFPLLLSADFFVALFLVINLAAALTGMTQVLGVGFEAHLGGLFAGAALVHCWGFRPGWPRVSVSAPFLNPVAGVLLLPLMLPLALMIDLTRLVVDFREHQQILFPNQAGEAARLRQFVADTGKAGVAAVPKAKTALKRAAGAVWMSEGVYT